MNKKREMKEYEAPFTKKTQVELEDSVCATSTEIQNPEGTNGEIAPHEVNKDFDYDFKNENWD